MTIACSHGNPDSKVHGANMGPIWGGQDPGGPHVGPMDFAIWEHMDMFCLVPHKDMYLHCFPISLCNPSDVMYDWVRNTWLHILPLYSFCCSFMVDLFELHKCCILWWCTIVNWASPKMLRLTKKQHKPYSFLYLWITSMAVIPETVLLSQASCIGLTQPYSLDGRSRWFLSLLLRYHIWTYMLCWICWK